MFELIRVVLVFLCGSNVYCQVKDSGENCLPRVPDKFGCSKDGQSFTDKRNCEKYVTCFMVNNCGEPYLGYRYSTCPTGYWYNEEQSACEGTPMCPTDSDQIRNASIICREEGVSYPHPLSCSTYYTCLKKKNIWYWGHYVCEGKEYFDPDFGDCRKGTCPGCHKRIPPHGSGKCKKQGDKFAHPDVCTKYFTCEPNPKRCGTGKWGRLEHDCPEGQFFDVIERDCKKYPDCPQVCPKKFKDQKFCKLDGQPIKQHDCRGSGEAFCDWVETCPNDVYVGYWTARCPYKPIENRDPNEVCKKNKQSFGYSSSCKAYVSCKKEKNGWSWEHKECAAKMYFDPYEGKCAKGLCPGCLGKIPPHGSDKCVEVGSRFGHPDDCAKFFTCERNPERCGTGSYGRLEENCPEGLFFDVLTNECVDSGTCPQKCPKKMSDQTKCKREGQELKSKNCNVNVICTRVETCPDELYQPYWHALCKD